MRDTLTQKQENFVNLIFEGKTQYEAWGLAGYSTNYSREVRDVHASQLATKDKIKIRLEELRQASRSKLVISETRRKEILSEIAEGNLIDYITCGPDRDMISVGPESPNTKAFQEISSRTEFDKDGAGVAVVTKLKLHDPIRAMDLLNKMDGIYTDGGGKTININIDKVYVDARGKLEDALKRLAGRVSDAEG